MSAQELRELLERLELTQGAAAALVGVDIRSVRRWLAGDAAVLEPAARVLRLASRLGVSRVLRLLDL
jgi:DNA-binding transcriptional regulator YiaG